MRNYLRAALVGAAFGLIVSGGAIAEDKGFLPLAQAQDQTDTIKCYEDDPCWDSKTMGDHRRGMVNDPAWSAFPRDFTLCRWNGQKWLWDYAPVAGRDLSCPFNYE